MLNCLKFNECLGWDSSLFNMTYTDCGVPARALQKIICWSHFVYSDFQLLLRSGSRIGIFVQYSNIESKYQGVASIDVDFSPFFLNFHCFKNAFCSCFPLIFHNTLVQFSCFLRIRNSKPDTRFQRNWHFLYKQFIPNKKIIKKIIFQLCASHFQGWCCLQLL